MNPVALTLCYTAQVLMFLGSVLLFLRTRQLYSVLLLVGSSCLIFHWVGVPLINHIGILPREARINVAHAGFWASLAGAAIFSAGFFMLALRLRKTPINPLQRTGEDARR